MPARTEVRLFVAEPLPASASASLSSAQAVSLVPPSFRWNIRDWPICSPVKLACPPAVLLALAVLVSTSVTCANMQTSWIASLSDLRKNALNGRLFSIRGPNLEGRPCYHDEAVPKRADFVKGPTPPSSHDPYIIVNAALFPCATEGTARVDSKTPQTCEGHRNNVLHIARFSPKCGDDICLKQITRCLPSDSPRFWDRRCRSGPKRGEATRFASRRFHDRRIRPMAPSASCEISS
jgi:hypothetical protein